MCDHHLWGEPDGLLCTSDSSDPAHGHTYVNSTGSDIADCAKEEL